MRILEDPEEYGRKMQGIGALEVLTGDPIRSSLSDFEGPFSITEA